MIRSKATEPEIRRCGLSRMMDTEPQQDGFSIRCRTAGCGFWGLDRAVPGGRLIRPLLRAAGLPRVHSDKWMLFFRTVRQTTASVLAIREDRCVKAILLRQATSKLPGRKLTMAFQELSPEQIDQVSGGHNPHVVVKDVGNGNKDSFNTGGVDITAKGHSNLTVTVGNGSQIGSNGGQTITVTT